MASQGTLRTCKKGHSYSKSTDCPTCPVCEREKSPKADFLVTGIWSEKSFLEAQKYGQAHLVASSKDEQFTTIPARNTWHLSDDAAYLH
jgi:phosphoserine aminotransferase